MPAKILTVDDSKTIRLIQKLRGSLKTEKLPVFGLSVKTAVEVALIELTLNVMKSADDLSLQTGVVCSPAMKQSFNNYEETKAWLFAATFEEAVKALNSGAVAAA